VINTLPTFPVFIGSGLNASNVQQYRNAHGFIVGSCLKFDGHWENDIDEKAVQHFIQACHLIKR
jgi:predicted TIM-barrel enzyme